MDNQNLVQSYLTTFAPEMVAIGLNALVYMVMKGSDKLQNSRLLRKDMILSVVVGGLITFFIQIIVNFAQIRNVCHRYASVGGTRFGFGDLAQKDLTLLVWTAPAVLECPTLLSFGIDDGICGFLHLHLAMMYIVVLAVMAVLPLFLYGVILQLTLTALPDNLALSEEQMVLKRSTKIVRGVLVGGIVVFLPVQLWNFAIEHPAITLITCFFISHVLLIVICVAEVICFAFMDPVFQLEYRLQKIFPEF